MDGPRSRIGLVFALVLASVLAPGASGCQGVAPVPAPIRPDDAVRCSSGKFAGEAQGACGDPAVAAETGTARGSWSGAAGGLPPEVSVPIRHGWRYIVLHHSGTVTGGAARFDRFHRQERGWEGGLGYHFVIGNGSDTADGAIEAGPRWLRQERGAHAGVDRYNDLGIGICLVGDFLSSPPSAPQLAALRRLVAALRRSCGIPANGVVTHGEIRPGTQCPGRHLTAAMALGG
ncbi:MAG: peptidoglycan recognition protein family protein [Planctomycetales bacterium]|nr:peptidoglycan recognition protein family protein [Planctomycetales bacterium]